MTKNYLRIIIVDVIVLAMFLIVAFVFPFEMNTVYWISLVFAVFAIAVQVLVIKSAFTKGNDVKSKFYGFPVAKIGIAYMSVQVALSLAAMIIVKFVDMAAWIPIIVYILLLGFSVIGFIAADATRDEVMKLDNKLKSDTSCMQALRSVVDPLVRQVEDPECRKALETLSNDFRYSDPVSSESIRGIESELSAQVSELQSAVLDADKTAIIELCKRTGITLTERNRLCKLNKR